MDHVKNLLKSSQTFSTTSLPQREDKQSASMAATLTAKLFLKMDNAYGHLWSSRFTTKDMMGAAIAEWARQIEPYGAEKIGQAWDQCMKSYQMPPSLPQFVALLRSKPAAHQVGPPALPRPPEDKEKTRAVRASLKQAIRGSRPCP